MEKIVDFTKSAEHTCDYRYDTVTGKFLCKKCGRAVTNADKKKALEKGNYLLKLDEALGDEGRKALDILLAVTICAKPISGCDACPRLPMQEGAQCKAPTDREAEWAVDFFT